MPRSLQLGLFAAGAVWMLAARSAAVQSSQGITTRLNLPALQPLLSACFLLFLLLVGFTVLDWLGKQGGDLRQANALPQRPTAANEWQVGAAVGWGALLLSVLPMMLAGRLHPQLWLGARAWGVAVLSVAALLVGTLAVEVSFRGYLFRRLIAATGPSTAAVLLSIFYTVVLGSRPNATALSVVVAFVAGLLFSLAYLRTHALWLGWGLHFAWNAAMAVLFGLPVGGLANFSSVVSTDVGGPVWLTGGAYGPEGALLTIAVLLATAVLLYRVTRDFAWHYTHEPIVSAGYPMNVAPPPAHTSIEAADSGASENGSQGLVQILPAAPVASKPAAAPGESAKSEAVRDLPTG